MKADAAISFGGRNLGESSVKEGKTDDKADSVEIGGISEIKTFDHRAKRNSTVIKMGPSLQSQAQLKFPL